MIQLRNVERTYKTGAGVTYVLRRIDLDIREGEFITATRILFPRQSSPQVQSQETRRSESAVHWICLSELSPAR